MIMGCFPCDYGTLLSPSDSRDKFNGIRSLLRFGRLISSPSLYSALPPLNNYSRLALKLFRGEPAISEFDWHFTPIHKSSQNLATFTGSALLPGLTGIQPAHG